MSANTTLEKRTAPLTKRRWARAGMGVLALLLVLIAVLLANTLRYPAPPEATARAPAPPADLDAAARRLAAAIRIRTVSSQAGEDADFDAFGRLLATSFPLAQQAFTRERVGAHSLLYTWPGSDPALAPVLLTAHMDTVPVEPGTEARWTHPPFSGAIADGFVWGRGTLDMKHAVMAIMEGAEHLLAQDFRPRRTILLAFGADEELGGADGAGRIAALLKARHVRAWFSMDEGSVILNGFIPGIHQPVAQIGLSEKGILNLELTVHDTGGHSSMPPPLTAVGRIARALARLEDAPMPASLNGPGGAGLRALAPALPFGQRVVMANTWLFGPAVLHQLSAAPATNAMLRTTTAPTIVAGGVKENVLPSQARAVVNFRLAPGDTLASVQAHVVAAIADPGVKVSRIGPGNEATHVANPDSAAYRLLARTVQDVVPGALVAPGLVVAGTDSRHYGDVSDAAFRFVPVRMTPADVERIHGTEERIAIANYGETINFYSALMRAAAADGAAAPAR